MSLQNVEAFYQQIRTDENFRYQVQQASTLEERNQIIQNAGYDFTQEEFEEFTEQLLLSKSEAELIDLDERELETVLGGLSGSLYNRVLIYGLPPLYFFNW